jgi:hypothetical protein
MILFSALPLVADKIMLFNAKEAISELSYNFSSSTIFSKFNIYHKRFIFILQLKAHYLVKVQPLLQVH